SSPSPRLGMTRSRSGGRPPGRSPTRIQGAPIMMALLSIAAGVVVALLAWNLIRRFGSDRIGALMEKRRATSRFVCRGELVDGNRHLDVAMAVTQSALFYE